MTWLRSKKNNLFALRDGRGPHRPVLALFSKPQWFEELDAAAFANDSDVSVVEPKDVDESICDHKTGKPKKGYRAKTYAEVKAFEDSQKSISKHLARRQVLAVDLKKLDEAEANLRATVAASPESAAGQRAKRSLDKADVAREAIYEELEKIEASLKLAGVDLSAINAMAAVDAASAVVDSLDPKKKQAPVSGAQVLDA